MTENKEERAKDRKKGYVRACLCLCVRMCSYVHGILACAPMRVYVCMCVCVYVCVWVSVRERERPKEREREHVYVREQVCVCGYLWNTHRIRV